MVGMSKITDHQNSVTTQISFCRTITFISATKGAVCPKSVEIKKKA